MRKYSNGNGTFDDILKVNSLLNKYKITKGCSCTIGSHNLKSLAEILDFFQNELEIFHGMFNYVQFGSKHSISPEDAAYALI